MSNERIIRMAAGFFVLFSLSLGLEVSPIFVNANWLWFTVFVGLNLFQSSFTQFCPLELILKKVRS